MSAGDPHDLSPEEFHEHVHSFEFWFGAVQGYLEGREYGHLPSTPDEALGESDRDSLITVLCNYCVGETAALEGAGGLIRIAPNRETKVFLSTQAVDEGRHLEVLIHRLRDLGVEEPENEIERRANPSLLEFKGRLLEFVEGGEWESALFAQNVILEAMEFAVFHRHASQADPITREVLLGIIKDERRHIGFGENELGRAIKEAPRIRDRLAIVRRELDHLVLGCFEHTMQELGSPRESANELSRSYMQAVERLGFS